MLTHGWKPSMVVASSEVASFSRKCLNMKPYVSIDIETTGLDPDNDQVLEIGAVIDNWEGPVEELPTFRCFVDNGTVQGNAYALSMHARTLRFIATKGKEWATGEPVLLGDRVNIHPTFFVAQAFHDWLRGHGINPAKRHLTVAGKNFSGFDRPFLEKLRHWVKLNGTQHRVADPGNLYWDPQTDLKGLPDLKTCMERAGITGEVAHTAVEDAIVVAKLVRYWNANAFTRGPFWKEENDQD
jgi:DNA polymerase III alpha subunit (gram-positive type)